MTTVTTPSTPSKLSTPNAPNTSNAPNAPSTPAAVVAPKLVLASSSPSRLALLRRAGIEPQVVVSGIDETPQPDESPVDLVRRLAVAKASFVARDLDSGLVVGCDSLLEFDGAAYGKPGAPQPAVDMWARLAGRRGDFHTGHCVIDAATGRQALAVCTTGVLFGSPSPDEVVTYVETGEPLNVAGAFKISHRGGWFVEEVHGEPSNLQGLSLPALRRLLADFGVSVTQLWA